MNSQESLSKEYDYIRHNKIPARLEEARILRDLINSSPNLVLGVTAPYGYGKSFFLGLLLNLLIKDNSSNSTVIFNPWRYDYFDKPLEAFIECLSPELITSSAPEAAKKIFNKLRVKLPLIIAKLLMNTPEWLSLYFTGDTTCGQLAKDAAQPFMDVFENDAKESLNQSLPEIIDDFKLTLKSYKESLGTQNLIIFIDELDRCRPSFALRLLEVIYHFFDIEGIYFIIAANIHQLKSFVAKKYGLSADTSGYLRRFFNLSYKISPPNDIEEFVKDVFKSNDEDPMILMMISEIAVLLDCDLRSISKLKHNLYFLKKFERKIFVPESRRQEIIHEYSRQRITHYDLIYAYLFFLILKLCNIKVYKQLKSGPDTPDLAHTRNTMLEKAIKNTCSTECNLDYPGFKAYQKILFQFLTDHTANTITRNYFTNYLGVEAKVITTFNLIAHSIDKLEIL